MSVNEVKLRTIPRDQAFVVKGTGHPCHRTFAIGNEDHTIGNALRHCLIQNSRVQFAGYSVPHPAEPVVQIRVQTTMTRNTKDDTADDDDDTTTVTAAEALRQACQTVSDQCDHMLQTLETLLPSVKEDRLRMEALLLEEEEEEETYEDEEAMEE